MKKFKTPLLFALRMMPAVAIAMGFSFAYQYDTAKEMFLAMTAQGLSLGTIFLAGMVQTLIMLFFACFFGRILAEKLGIWKPVGFQKKPLVLTLGFSLLGGGLIILDCLAFARVYPAILDIWRAGQTVLGLLTGLLYGGIVEELLMRLFCMSLFSWILWKLFARESAQAPAWVLIAGNVLAAMLFAAGHLPATVALFGELTPLLVLRCFLLNGVAGLCFGYLYRKYGLAYAMCCHMGFHVFFKLTLFLFL